jgi:HlyD family secretion protein
MRRILIALVTLALVGVGFYGVRTLAGSAAPPQAQTLPTATPGPARDVVVAEAKVLPLRSAALRFEAGGTVAEVLVREGDAVAAGQPLAQLDTRALELQQSAAEATLAEREARYDALVEGATPEEVARAEAQRAQAEAQLREVRGRVTALDVRAAQAQLDEARAALKELESGASATAVQSAQAALDQAQANLQAQRDGLSAAKTGAQLQMEQAVQALTQAQSVYATAKGNWERAQDSGRDPLLPDQRNPQTGEQSPNNLNDAQLQQYYDAFVRGEATMRQAEAAVQQAVVAFDNARQQEVTGIQRAEAQVRDAQAHLEDLLNGADADAIAAARARVAQALANVAQLNGEQRGGSLEAAQAAVAGAEADLAAVTGDARSTDLAIAQAQVQAAVVALNQAKLAVDKATLRAPIAGTVASLNLEIGELADPTRTVVTIGDLSELEVETDDLTELQVVTVSVGDPATLTIEALPGVVLPARVTRIRAIGEEKEGDITYSVTVVPERQDARLRWNMTVTVAIDPQT